MEGRLLAELGRRAIVSCPASRRRGRCWLLVAVLSWTISPYSSLMPVYAKDIYGGGPQTLGFLLAAAGAGALASTLYLASRATVRGSGARDRRSRR